VGHGFYDSSLGLEVRFGFVIHTHIQLPQLILGNIAK
jgi:hypothetical protein